MRWIPAGFTVGLGIMLSGCAQPPAATSTPTTTKDHGVDGGSRPTAHKTGSTQSVQVVSGDQSDPVGPPPPPLPLTEAGALQIATHHARFVDGLAFPMGMQAHVTHDATFYRVTWVPQDPYDGGFEYVVTIEATSGHVVDASANSLAPAPPP